MSEKKTLKQAFCETPKAVRIFICTIVVIGVVVGTVKVIKCNPIKQFITAIGHPDDCPTCCPPGYCPIHGGCIKGDPPMRRPPVNVIEAGVRDPEILTKMAALIREEQRQTVLSAHISYFYGKHEPSKIDWEQYQRQLKEKLHTPPPLPAAAIKLFQDATFEPKAVATAKKSLTDSWQTLVKKELALCQKQLDRIN
jgi:hypothetical protein